MNDQNIQKFSVIGISIRTTNENGQAGKDIPALWNKFMSEGAAEKIPGRTDNAIYCIYTEYEKDHTKPHTTILGCKVDNLNAIPAGMVGKTFNGGKYARHIAKGDILQGIIFDAWTKIWNSDLDRAFTADFEVYGEKAQNPGKAEVEIFIAVK
jgi:predicted transcriptional regulator YdeE